MKVTVLVRPGCHLCEDALAELHRYLSSRDPDEPRIEVEQVDIERDDDLHRRYLERIPVIQVDGEIVSELWFEEAAFELALGNRSRPSG